MPDISMRFHKDMLVLEGGTATMLASQGVSGDDCPELLNALEPETIENNHLLFKMAGAHCAISNTFGGSKHALSAFGLDDKAAELNREGVRLARVNSPEHILANIGPCGIMVDSLSGDSYEAAFEQYREQAAALAAEKPDAIYIETMMCIEDAICAVSAAKSACELPVLVSCTFDDEGNMVGCGTSIEDAAEALERAGASVIGMNHLLDFEQMIPNARRLCSATTLPTLVSPDVFDLSDLGKVERRNAIDKVARCAEAYREMGVQFIGACCNTTPAYIGAIYATVGGLDVVERA
ncbi:MAG: homocysteine S-methyltransferase family protein [Coriobacteriales bacterium]|nr:homocysteine S-methyltransferase family protein [Coriobacteriales bacterium]